METDTLSIAKEIRSQLGHKCLYMLGAFNLLAHDDGLSFRIRGSRKVNYIKITLNALDLYDIEFRVVSVKQNKLVVLHGNVYFDMMHSLIEKETGLYTKL